MSLWLPYYKSNTSFHRKLHFFLNQFCLVQFLSVIQRTTRKHDFSVLQKHDPNLLPDFPHLKDDVDWVLSGFVCALILLAMNNIACSIENPHGTNAVGTVLDNVLFLEPWKSLWSHLFEANKRLEEESKAKSAMNSLPCGRLRWLYPCQWLECWHTICFGWLSFLVPVCPWISLWATMGYWLPLA